MLLQSSILYSKVMILEKNTAEILQLDREITDVFVANPDIADAQISSSNAIFIFGKDTGVTTISGVDSKGEIIFKLNLNIIHNLSKLNSLIKSLFPEENVRINSYKDSIVLSGEVSSSQIAANMKNIIIKYVRESEFVNNLKITTPTQVYLKVKIAEVSKKIVDKLGINWDAAFSSGKFRFGVLTGINPFTNNNFVRDSASNRLGIRFYDRHSQYSALLDMLATENLASILAEPNLVALSGETASFIAGGEFPYPVPQGSNNQTTIEFKEYGTKLSFTPTILSPERIHLRIRPEFSEIDFTTAVSLGTGSVPGTRTRKAETSVVLSSGESLAIGGLFQTHTSNQIKDLPGSDIPIFGSLFRKTELIKEDTELVIIASPFLVKPSKTLDLPTDNLEHAALLEMFFHRKLASTNKDKKNLKIIQDNDLKLIGPAGFYIID